MSANRQGKKQEFEAAYREHADFVFKVCLRFAGGDRSWALDRTHDVFMSLDSNMEKLDLEQALRPWLRRVAVNECLQDLRRGERRRRLLGVFGMAGADHAESPVETLKLGRDRIALDRALGRLPMQQRLLLTLMYFEGESLTEAAARVGVSKGQASKLHKKALARLAELEWELQ